MTVISSKETVSETYRLGCERVVERIEVVQVCSREPAHDCADRRHLMEETHEIQERDRFKLNQGSKVMRTNRILTSLMVAW